MYLEGAVLGSCSGGYRLESLRFYTHTHTLIKFTMIFLILSMNENCFRFKEILYFSFRLIWLTHLMSEEVLIFEISEKQINWLSFLEEIFDNILES